VLLTTLYNDTIRCVKAVINYINSSVDEVKRVTWPTKKEALRLTAYVIGVSLIVGLLVMGFDYIFANTLSIVLGFKK